MPPLIRLPLAQHNAATPGRFVSQSECNTALACGAQWFGTWFLGFRPQYPESMPQRVGSMGHAVLHDRVIAVRSDPPRACDPAAAEDAERVKRGWGEWTSELEYEASLAEAAASTLAEHLNLDACEVLRAPGGGLLAETRLRVTWAEMEAAGFGKVIAGLDRLRATYSGIEGQPDIGLVMDGGVRTCLDFKMRQKSDLGGANEDSGLPDLQGAFYKVLCASSGVVVDEFRQANVYAGAWLTIDDFMDEKSPYVGANGLPSRDMNKLGAMVRPEVWAEAWRLLVERKRVAHSLRPVKLSAKTGKPLAGQEWEPPDDWDARQFIRTLATVPTVAVRSFRLDMSICRDVVRDMLAAIDISLGAALANVTPARNLRNYPNSPCVKRFGCPVQDVCRASLGTGNLGRVMREHADAGAFTRMSAEPLGVIPDGV